MFDPADQSIDMIVKIAARTDLGRIAISQWFQRRGQDVFVGHGGPADEDWNHRNSPSNCGFNLDPHEITRIIQPPCPLRGSLLKRDAQPVIADHGQQDIALADRLAQVIAKIDAEGNTVHILEDAPLPKLRDQPLENPIGRIQAVVAAIGQKKL